MKLYSYWRSSASWRVRLVLAHKQLAYDYEAVHLIEHGGEHRAPSFLVKNPFATVPLLEVEGEGGAPAYVSQSLAIAAYLEARFPERALAPSDPLGRARVTEIAEFVNAGIHPLQNLSVLRHVRDRLGADERSWARHWVSEGLASLETRLAETAGSFAVGDAFTLADACVVPQLFNARRFGVDLAPYPTLLRVEASVAAAPDLAAAHPTRQPDAPAESRQRS